MNRIAARFAALKSQSRKGLITFITAGDPDRGTSQRILEGLPGWGADFIELGMPFSDPMADGSAVQDAGLRALATGAHMRQTLQMARDFRVRDKDTPLILMGYYNPIYIYGTANFIADAVDAGIDGLIIVDLPPEEDAELRIPANAAGLAVIRLITPTTDLARLPVILDGATGFLYVVSITGITGTASANADSLRPQLEHLRRQTDLPIVVGFGINSGTEAAKMAAYADGVVVGSALVKALAGLDGSIEISNKVKELAKALAV